VTQGKTLHPRLPFHTEIALYDAFIWKGKSEVSWLWHDTQKYYIFIAIGLCGFYLWDSVQIQIDQKENLASAGGQVSPNAVNLLKLTSSLIEKSKKNSSLCMFDCAFHEVALSVMRLPLRRLLSPSSGRPDGGGSKDLWNVGKLLPDYTVLQPRRQQSSYSPPWEPQILLRLLLVFSSTLRALRLIRAGLAKLLAAWCEQNQPLHFINCLYVVVLRAT
jgi:hypothetical protein